MSDLTDAERTAIEDAVVLPALSPIFGVVERVKADAYAIGRAEAQAEMLKLICAQREAFLDSPDLALGWIAGWRSAVDHVAHRVANQFRARQKVKRLMAEDPLDAGEAAPLVEPPDPEPVIKFRITLVESDEWSGRSRSTEDYDTYEAAETRIKEVNSQNTSPVAPSYYVQAEKTITAVQVDQP